MDGSFARLAWPGKRSTRFWNGGNFRIFPTRSRRMAPFLQLPGPDASHRPSERLATSSPPPAEESLGPAAGRSGSKAGNSAPTPPKGKGASAASRLLRDVRPDSKQSRATWGRMVHPEHHAGGGGGGGSRRLKGPAKKGLAKGCFGLKLDRIGSMSGLGC
uniref:C-type natriuretic peptide n=1 Tax=Laticauda laticaudata TaxID=8630 RepID=A0A8C5T0L1_LATLA